MNWSDDGIILGGRRFGEGGLILDVLTRNRGRRSGLVYGGNSRQRRAQYEAGNSVSLSWTGRLEDQLGRFEVAEASKERASHVLDDAKALAAVSAITSILRMSLDEGDVAGSAMFEATEVLLDQIEAREIWPALYVRWELGLLSALGFGLDLQECAISGANDGLTHVSPRTGRAVRGSEGGRLCLAFAPVAFVPCLLFSAGRRRGCRRRAEADRIFPGIAGLPRDEPCHATGTGKAGEAIGGLTIRPWRSGVRRLWRTMPHSS
jgi:DNA repair protein RecO (recombination protein O)